MLGLAEKIQFGFSAFILMMVLAVMAIYLFLGIETTAVDLLPEAQLTRNQVYAVPRDDDQAAKAPPGANGFNNRMLVENRELLRKLEKDQGVPVNLRRIERKSYQIPPETYEYISQPKHWLPELDKAGSSVKLTPGGKGTLLEITSIEEDSLLKKVGLQEGDTVALINGEVPPSFDPTRSRDFHELAGKCFKALDAGQKISITVLRNGQPVHIEFQR